MQRLICSVLDIAEKARLTSLALPLLGCGAAGWLMPLVAKATIKLLLTENSMVTSTVKVGVFELQHQLDHFGIYLYLHNGN